MQKIKELAHFGGFLDTAFLKRTLAEEFQQMESWYATLPFLFLFLKIPIIVFEASPGTVTL